VIAQGDLIERGGLPLRLGLLGESGDDLREKALIELDAAKPSDVMSAPAVTIEQDKPLTEAVELMLNREVKRLPVVDAAGRLTGMLSRLDVFRTVMRESPDWNAFQAQKIEVKNLRRVKDILRRDAHAVSPETPVSEVIRIIDSNDIQRVVVVDEEGKPTGLISDRDLLRFFKHQETGLWALLTKKKPSFESDSCGNNLLECLAATKARDVMNAELIVVPEKMFIEEAIALMTEKALKRLPVVDENGKFKGMISRDSLLRTGYFNLK
jgi:CBS domain-containing protein